MHPLYIVIKNDYLVGYPYELFRFTDNRNAIEFMNDYAIEHLEKVNGVISTSNKFITRPTKNEFHEGAYLIHSLNKIKCVRRSRAYGYCYNSFNDVNVFSLYLAAIPGPCNCLETGNEFENQKLLSSVLVEILSKK